MTSKAYVVDETTVTWRASAGTHALTLTSLGASAGQNGALRDFGVTARSNRFKWRAFVKFATVPVVGELVEVYWKTGDGTHYDNDDGTGDVALSAVDKLRNLKFIGFIAVDEASTTPEFSASGEFTFDRRYGGPVFYNRTADALSSTAGDHGFDLIPVPIQGQAT